MIIALFDGDGRASGTDAAIFVARSAAYAGIPATLPCEVVRRESGPRRVASVPDAPHVVERRVIGPSPRAALHRDPRARPRHRPRRVPGLSKAPPCCARGLAPPAAADGGYGPTDIEWRDEGHCASPGHRATILRTPLHMDGNRRWTSSDEGSAHALRRLWRTVGPGALDPDLAKPLQATVEAACRDVGRAGPAWDDGPRRVGEALVAVARFGVPHPETDVAVTAVLAHALGGDPNAARVLAGALDLLASTGGGGSQYARFARAWRDRSALPFGTSERPAEG